MPWLEPVTLSGPHAQLKPLSHDHCDGLTEAVKDGELWKLWYTFVPEARRHGQGDRSPARPAGRGLDAAVHGVRCRRQDRRHDDLHERRCAEPAGRDRLDLVRQARAAQRGQHPVQIAAADATPSRSSIASRSSSAPISSTTRAGAASSGSAPSWTASCAAIRLRRTARCATPWSTASSPANGRR